MANHMQDSKMGVMGVDSPIQLSSPGNINSIGSPLQQGSINMGSPLQQAHTPLHQPNTPLHQNNSTPLHPSSTPHHHHNQQLHFDVGDFPLEMNDFLSTATNGGSRGNSL